MELESGEVMEKIMVSIVDKFIEKGPLYGIHHIQNDIIKLKSLILGGCQGNHDCEIDLPFCHNEVCYGKLLTSCKLVLLISI